MGNHPFWVRKEGRFAARPVPRNAHAMVRRGTGARQPRKSAAFAAKFDDSSAMPAIFAG
jgi:hypothetical protein